MAWLWTSGVLSVRHWMKEGWRARVDGFGGEKYNRPTELLRGTAGQVAGLLLIWEAER